MQIEPIGERVLIQQEEDNDRTQGGLYIPESAKEDKKEGTVVAVGKRENGEDLPLKKGDKVLYGGYSAEDFNFNGKKHVFVEFKDILARIN